MCGDFKTLYATVLKRQSTLRWSQSSPLWYSHMSSSRSKNNLQHSWRQSVSACSQACERLWQILKECNIYEERQEIKETPFLCHAHTHRHTHTLRRTLTHTIGASAMNTSPQLNPELMCGPPGKVSLSGTCRSKNRFSVCTSEADL